MYSCFFVTSDSFNFYPQTVSALCILGTCLNCIRTLVYTHTDARKSDLFAREILVRRKGRIVYAPFPTRAHPENAFTFSRNLLMPPKFCTRAYNRAFSGRMDMYIHRRVYICSIYFIKYVTSRIFASLSSPPHTSRTRTDVHSHTVLSLRPGNLKIKVNPPRLHWTRTSLYDFNCTLDH